ncbi:polyprenyl synthetase family protein [Glaciecola sp. 1036]|uniref:polyprenyl synthetase family protein n=1 Tax=Alteromonadaceae TaxID=72275 RepID=UPI003D084892
MTPIKGTGQRSKDHQAAQRASSVIDPSCYPKMEQKARWYFTQLHSLCVQDDFLTQLTSEYQQWANTQINSKQNLALSEIEKKMQQGEGFDSLSFLQKLSMDNQLKDYLDKSLSYIFMRDLGKSIRDQAVAEQISRLSQRIQKWVRKKQSRSEKTVIENSFIEQKAMEYQVTDAVNWLKSKLQVLEQKLPESLDKNNGLRKLVKVLAGVVMHQLIELPKDISNKQRAERLDKAIRLGYCYGLTYPLIDDIQDSSNFLDSDEKEAFNQAIRESLLCGKVTAFPEFKHAHKEVMSFIYEELEAAFKCIQSYLSDQEAKYFFEQAFVFFEAQNIDRKKSLNSNEYSDESLYLPVILKSSGSRLLARDIVHNHRDEDFDYRTFCFGIYNQFNDDIKDLFSDIAEDNLTPYSYYYMHPSAHENNINPYRVYWAVVYHLISQVYENDSKVTALFLERSINAHKSLKNDIGDAEYKKLEKSLLTTGNQAFDKLISRLVHLPNQVAWFDKLISREVSDYFEKQRRVKEQFKQEFVAAQDFINQHIELSQHHRIPNTQLAESANYALAAGGKRLRPVLAYISLTQRYGFSENQTIPVLQLLEYMHTASLIFDDKPSQDNASFRRGKPALHTHCKSEAQAELAGVYLMMKAVEVQTRVQNIAPEHILASIQYAANTTQAICEGQLLDLQSHNQQTSIEDLEQICFLKTSLAIEAAILIPAILAGVNDIEKEHLKRFAKYLGLVFQLKDDLLDAQGDAVILGKPTQQDIKSSKATFVTLLGIDNAQDKLMHYQSKALESLNKLATKSHFYEQLLEYVALRQH